MHNMILGLTGTNAAGKGTIAKFLQEQGYEYHSLSDVIRDEATARGMKHTRDNLIFLGNELRTKSGNGVLAEKILEKVNLDKNAVIDSIRNPAEIEKLRKNPKFFLVGVDADIKIRYNRILSRKRVGEETLTLKQFEKQEKKEMNEKGSGQQLRVCLKKAEAVIINEGTKEELKQKLEQVLKKARNQTIMRSRPSWDEYFMKMTYLVQERVTCLRRRVGAVVVRDKIILSTGYNGPAKGLPHCSEVGCEREKRNIPSGQQLDICRAVHAEENCVAQAAANGISIKGATLYCNTFPCAMCAKLLINAGIKEIVWDGDYQNPLSKQMLTESKVKIRRFQIKQ